MSSPNVTSDNKGEIKKVLNMPEYGCIMPYGRVLNMPGIHRVLNKSLVLNNLGLRIWQGC